jgi:hypothetical protein
MRRSLIEEDNVQALCIVPAEVLQKDREALGIEAGELPPEGVARGGFNCCIQPVRFIEGLDDLEGLHAIPRHSAADWEMQPQAAFILAKHPHRLLWALAA